MADSQRTITVGWQLRAYPTPDQEAKLTDWSTGPVLATTNLGHRRPWWQAQHRPAVLETWRQKRIRRGRRPLPPRYYAAPRFQPARHRLNVRWQNQSRGVLARTAKRRGQLKVVGFGAAGLGTLTVHLDAGFPPGPIKSIRVRRDAEGLWWVGLSIDTPAAAHKPATQPVVGLDRGVTIPVATSHGPNLTVIAGLKAGEQRRLRLLERRIARIHRTTSPECHKPGARCTGRCDYITAPSKNLIELRHQVAKLRSREARRRQQARHTFTARISDTYDHIVIEDLHTRSMTATAQGSTETPGTKVAQKRGLNRSIQRIGWHEMERQLTYKAARKGRTVVKVPAAHTSTTCADCGATDPASRRRSRYQCTSCGHRANADENAAQVIEQRGTGTSPDTPERIGREAGEPATAAGVEPATNPPSTGEHMTTMSTTGPPCEHPGGGRHERPCTARWGVGC